MFWKPLFLGEFNKLLENSNLLTILVIQRDTKTSSKKRGGEKSHFFAKFIKISAMKKIMKTLLN